MTVAPAGGKSVSSSLPGARSDMAQPLAGIARTLGPPGDVHAAALPSYSIPPKWRQCQQGEVVPVTHPCLLLAQHLDGELASTFRQHDSIKPLPERGRPILNPVGVQEQAEYFGLDGEVDVLRHVAGELRQLLDVQL